MGRLKVRVPHIYGPSKSDFGSVSTKDIPWALPVGMPAGNSPASGGISWLPEPGDQVYVRFLNLEPEKPIWEWGNQTIAGTENLKLHQHDEKTGLPKRAALTRYGHTIEFNSESILEISAKGNAWMLDDKCNGGLLHINEDLTYNIGEQWVVLANDFDFEAIKRMRFSADVAITYTTKDMALIIDEDYILQAGKGFSIFSGDEECSTLSLKNGKFAVTDSGGGAIALGDGAGAISASTGSYVSVDGQKVVLYAAPLTTGLPGASITVDNTGLSSVTFMCNSINFDTAGFTVGSALGSQLTVQTTPAGVTIKSGPTPVPIIIQAGAHTLTIDPATGFTFV